MKNLILLLVISSTLSISFSQNITPNLEWRKVDWPDHYPSGNIFNITNDHQSQTESAEDWWYDIVPSVDEQGRNNGFITSGYATWLDLEVNENIHNGCYNIYDTEATNCNRPILDGQEISAKLAMIGKYDMFGNMLWCKSYCHAKEGAISVTPTSDGSYVFVGWSRITRDKFGNVVPLNPTASNPSGYDIASLNFCDENEVKTIVGKVNSDGDLLWLNQYSFYDVTGTTAQDETNVSVSNSGLDVIEMPDGRLKILANSEDLNDLDSDDNARTKFFLFNVESNGNLIPSSRKLIGDDGYLTTPRDIEIDQNGDYYVSGSQQVPSGDFNSDALLFKIDEDNLIQPFSSYSFSGSTAAIRYNTTSQGNKVHNVGQDVSVLNNDKVAWSLIEDCTGCRWSGSNIGKGKVLLFDLTDNTTKFIDLQLENSFGFNDIRAFDMKMGLTKTFDGGFALVTSVQNQQLSVDTPPFDDFIADLNNQVSGIDCSSYFNSTEIEMWNTDAYVAKFDENGDLLWDKTFDSDDQAPGYHPGDMKKQECLYRVAEGEDGSLAIVGNTSHNIDDYYTAKIGSDCNLRQSYDIEPDNQVNEVVYDSPGNTIVIDANTYNKPVIKARGELKIKEDTKLVIDGITVEFADTRKSHYRTQLIVERGAKLELKNGATLTSVSDCPGSMWDGVEVWGNKDESQSSGNFQGRMTMNNATIENAHIGVSMVKRIGWDKQSSYTGGILIARNSQFINNIVSVEFRPYQHQVQSSSGLVPVSNVSRIIECDFSVDGLNDPQQYYGYNSDGELKPRSHDAFIYLDGIKGVRIQGNNFVNNDPVAEGEFRGKGIYAWKSDFNVIEQCASNQPIGQECPSADKIPNVFENLYNGIHVRPIGASAGILIRGNEFTNNEFGIVFEGSSNFADIHSNSFEIDENSGVFADAHGGIYLQSASGFKIENNTFEGITQTATGNNGGIFVENSSFITASEIYRNDFDMLDVNIQSADDNKFMEVDCNTFNHSSPGIDWHNTPNGTVDDQGLCVSLDPEAPHANFFGGAYTIGNDYQIYNQGAVFEYSSYSDNNYLPQNDFVDNVIINNCLNFIPNINEVCPSRLPSVGFEEADVQLSLLDAEIGDIDGTVDGVGVSGLISSILNDPFHQVRHNLIEKTPYLPDTVLHVLIEESRTPEWLINQVLSKNAPLSTKILNTLIFSSKTFNPNTLRSHILASTPVNEDVLINLLSKSPSLPDWVIKEVLMDNSPLRATTLVALLTNEQTTSNYVVRDVLKENTPVSPDVDAQFLANNYPSWVVNAVNNSAVEAEDPSIKIFTKTPLESLLKKRDYLENEATKIVNRQVRRFLQEDKLDSAVVLLENRGNIRSSCALLPLLKLRKDTSRMEHHLTIIRDDATERENDDPDDRIAKEERALCTFYELTKNIENQPNGYDAITSTQISQLESFADRDVAMATSYNNLLVYIEKRDEERRRWKPIQFGNMNKSSNSQHDFKPLESNIKKDATLLLYPNPSYDLLNINYAVEDENGSLDITIHNMLGNEVFRQALNNHQGSIQIETINLSNGVYIVNLSNDSNAVKTKKLVIQH